MFLRDCAFLLAMSAMPASAQPQDAVEPPLPPEPEVLTQGPIHEAFAEPVDYRLGERIVVDQAPPEPVREEPAAYRPEGDQVEWLPGYWMWDDARGDFVWVSGVWRVPPPGRRWVLGYWSEAAAGYVWTSGFWAPIDDAELEYFPYPPECLDVGPTSPAPSNSHFWVPGCWRWRRGGYVWSPGYWYPGQANWAWVPSRYLYTARGAVYVRGYWDYPLIRRGLLFAPVRWAARSALYNGYRYRPRSIVNTAVLATRLFTHNRYGQYYFGPYGAYAGSRSIVPWFSAYAGYASRRGYDPLLAYNAWNHGGAHGDWLRDLNNRFQQPGQGRENRSGQLVRSIDPTLRNSVAGRPLRAVDADDRIRTEARMTQSDELQRQRRRLEQGDANRSALGLARRQGEPTGRGETGRLPLEGGPGAAAFGERRNSQATLQLPPVRRGGADVGTGNRSRGRSGDANRRGAGDRAQGNSERILSDRGRFDAGLRTRPTESNIRQNPGQGNLGPSGRDRAGRGGQVRQQLRQDTSNRGGQLRANSRPPRRNAGRNQGGGGARGRGRGRP